MKLNKIIFGLVLFFSASLQASDKFIIDDIRIQGLQRVALGATLTYVPVKVGDELTPFRSQQLIRSLYASNHFENIKLMREGNGLIIQVQERPVIANVIFEGNDDIKDEQLQDSLNSSDIIVGEPLDKTVLSSIENGLKDFYYSIGKYSADVTAIITPLPRNRVDLKFKFEEGDSAEIAQINIVGNELFDDATLLSKFELEFDAPWWNFMAETRYQQQKLDGDIETLTSFYMDRGYLQFKVKSTQVSMTPEKDALYITINVDEGVKYEISEIELAGDLIGQEGIIEKLLPLRAGVTYNQAQVTYAEEFVSKYLGRFGYAYPTVTTIPDIDEASKSVKLTLSVDPGKRIYVRNITFKGNNITSDRVLRHNVTQMEGAWLSNDALEVSKAQLSRLTYLEEVEFDTIRLPGEEDLVDIDFTVKEQPAGSFNAGIGYGDRTKLSLQLGIQQDNFLGTGKQVGINLNTVSYQQSIALTYNDPYFTIDNISLGGSISYSEFDGSDFNVVSYNSKRLRTGLNIGYPINATNRINFGVSYNSTEIFNRSYYEQTSLFYDQFLAADNPDAAIEYDYFQLSGAWLRNTLNRGMFPTAGSSQRASVSVSTPNSSVLFFKAMLDTKFYFPLTRNQKWSLLARARLGYGNGYADVDGVKQILPFTENFTAGGSDTLRGFENNTVGPRGIQRVPTTLITDPNGVVISGSPENDLLSVSRRSLGGNAMALAGIELIFPTPFIGEDYENSVRTSAFFDAGNVWDTEFNYDQYKDLAIVSGSDPLQDYSDWSAIRSSAGVSVQWISPMGPIVFSFSKAITKEAGDDAKFFTFNIGQTF